MQVRLPSPARRGCPNRSAYANLPGDSGGRTVATVYDLKPRFQALLRPLCARMARAGITANAVTIAALVLSLAEGVWLALTPGAPPALIALPAVLFVRMALNAIDGMLAREFHQMSDLGAFLNEGGDIVSDMVLYLPFTLVPGVRDALVVLVVMLAVVSELTGIFGALFGGARRYDGPFGKSDRALFFGALALVLAVGIEPGLWSEIALWLAVALGVLTIVNRARRALAAPPK